MLAKVLFKTAQQFKIQDVDSKHIHWASSYKKTVQANQMVVVGDLVRYQKIAHGYVIHQVMPRINYLLRPKVSNVAIVVVVIAAKQPAFDFLQLRKMLVFYHNQGVQEIICYFTKLDLLSEQELQTILAVAHYLIQIGYQTYLSTTKKENKSKLLSLLEKNQTVCFAGLSGVGKSTLLNYLIPDLALKTQAVSKSLQRGKNTTTNPVLIPYDQGYLVDTPGFSQLYLPMAPVDLAGCFMEFLTYLGQCQFADCLHLAPMAKKCLLLQTVQKTPSLQLAYQQYQTLLEQLRKHQEFQ